MIPRLEALIFRLREAVQEKSARLLQDGLRVALAGRPNVGKSSLLNALLGEEKAIVTPIPGTTRDVLTERISLGGVVAELSDTAGRRDTCDPIEKLGVERAQRAAERADVVLIVLDAAEALDAGDAELVKNADRRAVICLHKSDLTPVLTAQGLKEMTGAKILEISARTGEGIAALIDELTRRVAPDEEGGGVLTAQRHIELAKSAADSLELAIRAVEEGLPLDTAAIDIREALSRLADITGENATEAVIDRVFASFCVGK
jgi:tRNA modification GTPase